MQKVIIRAVAYARLDGGKGGLKLQSFSFEACATLHLHTFFPLERGSKLSNHSRITKSQPTRLLVISMYPLLIESLLLNSLPKSFINLTTALNDTDI